MKVALVTVSICRHTGKELNREVKETFEVDEDEFFRPLVEVLGDAFLDHHRKIEEA